MPASNEHKTLQKAYPGLQFISLLHLCGPPCVLGAILSLPLSVFLLGEERLEGGTQFCGDLLLLLPLGLLQGLAHSPA